MVILVDKDSRHDLDKAGAWLAPSSQDGQLQYGTVYP